MTRLWPQGTPVPVRLSADGLPQDFAWEDQWRRVAAVARRWRVRAGWWTPGAEAWQEYFKLTTADGLLCILIHDLRSGEWRLVRVYD